MGAFNREAKMFLVGRKVRTQSPHFFGGESREWSFLSTRRLWKCKACKKQFSVKGRDDL
jgi:hypothetical protein